MVDVVFYVGLTLLLLHILIILPLRLVIWLSVLRLRLLVLGILLPGLPVLLRWIVLLLRLLVLRLRVVLWLRMVGLGDKLEEGAYLLLVYRLPHVEPFDLRLIA